MTNSWRSSVLKSLSFAVLSLAVAGCGCSSSDEAEGDSAGAAPSWHPDDVPAIQTAAHEAYARGDWVEAGKAFSRLAFDESLPADVRSLGWTGKGVIELKRLNEASSPDERCDIALTSLLTALNYDPRNASARFHLGYLYRNAFGFHQAALDQFKMFVALMKDAPDDPHVVKANSIVAELNGEIAEERARRPGVQRQNRTACTSAIRRGDAAAAKGRTKEALAEYEKAYAADPLCFDAAERLAGSWMKDRSAEGTDRAYRYACAAASLRTTNAKTLSTAAELAARLKRPMSAAKLWLRAVASNPTDRTAIDGLVSALTSAGLSRRATVYRRYRDGLPRGR